MNSKLGDRIKFASKKDQIEFLNNVFKRSGCSFNQLGEAVGKSERTVRDWFRGKYNMPYDAAVNFSKVAKVPLPKTAVREKWGTHLKDAAKKGGKEHFKKYGRVKVDEKHRKNKWRKWWDNEGRFKDHPIINKSLPFRKPDFSEELAEFVGIVLGDGHISKRQITIFLHREDDKEFGRHIYSLAKKLFRIPVGTYENKKFKCTNYIISRTEIVRFLTDELGMKVGNKVEQQVDIPRWIKIHKSFSRACVRGLIDTDGCFFKHKYMSKGKLYSYDKIMFTSRSEPLLRSVFEILVDNGIKSRFTKRYDVWLDSKESVKKYMSIIGSNNPKRLNRHYK